MKLKQLLTERERDVIKLLTKGFTNNEISEILHISIHTTKAHLESIYEKIEVSNRLQASIKAVYDGIVDIEDAIQINS